MFVPYFIRVCFAAYFRRIIGQFAGFKSYFKNEKAKLVLNATMRMVHDMGLKVVSEGVETKEQLDMLVELGIDYIQGYYFSKPLPADEFMAFMIENNK